MPTNSRDIDSRQASPETSKGSDSRGCKGTRNSPNMSEYVDAKKESMSPLLLKCHDIDKFVKLKR